MADTVDPTLRGLTAKIVASHIANNVVAAEDLPALIDSVFATLAALGRPEQPASPKPAVPIRNSVFPDYIICLEDGRKLKMLKRHLQTSYNMTPGQYRERWGLPADYPMVAPSYAAHRSLLAKEIGLGRRPGEGKAAPLRRGRPKKAA